MTQAFARGDAVQERDMAAIRPEKQFLRRAKPFFYLLFMLSMS
jgi:hypothetical protein